MRKILLEKDCLVVDDTGKWYSAGSDKDVRDALIAFMAATAQAEATKEAQKAGIEAARQDKSKYRGKKPSYDGETLGVVVDMLGKGSGASEIAKLTGLTQQTVLRIKGGPAVSEEALRKWGL